MKPTLSEALRDVVMQDRFMDEAALRRLVFEAADALEQREPAPACEPPRDAAKGGVIIGSDPTMHVLAGAPPPRAETLALEQEAEKLEAEYLARTAPTSREDWLRVAALARTFRAPAVSEDTDEWRKVAYALACDAHPVAIEKLGGYAEHLRSILWAREDLKKRLAAAQRDIDAVTALWRDLNAAWTAMDTVLVECGMDKKTQPVQACEWVRGRLRTAPPAAQTCDVEAAAYELSAANYPGGVDCDRAADILRKHLRPCPPALAQEPPCDHKRATGWSSTDGSGGFKCSDCPFECSYPPTPKGPEPVATNAAQEPRDAAKGGVIIGSDPTMHVLAGAPPPRAEAMTVERPRPEWLDAPFTQPFGTFVLMTDGAEDLRLYEPTRNPWKESADAAARAALAHLGLALAQEPRDVLGSVDREKVAEAVNEAYVKMATPPMMADAALASIRSQLEAREKRKEAPREG